YAIRRDSELRMILIEPSLTQDLVAGAQEAAHLDGLAAAHGEVELRPPVSRHVVRHGLSQEVGEFSPGGRQDRLRDNPLRQAGERLALELDHELADTLRTRRARLPP